MPTRRTILPSLIAVAMVSMAACGGDDTPTPPTGPTPPPVLATANAYILPGAVSMGEWAFGLTLRTHAGTARDATVRRVASHTAGLPAYQNFYFADEHRQQPPMAEAIRRYGLIVAPPGTRFAYSNLGYAILGHAIAQISGQDYGTYLQREVFTPLGMTHSALDAPTTSAAIRYAPDGTPLPPYQVDTVAASSLYASAEDLVRLASSTSKHSQPVSARSCATARSIKCSGASPRAPSALAGRCSTVPRPASSCTAAAWTVWPRSSFSCPRSGSSS